MDKNILYYIKKINRPIFTTYELSAISGKSPSSVIQSLEFLKKQAVVFKVYRGIWAEADNKKVTPYSVIPFLFPKHRVYLSFISALHLYGIIEQIPQIITLASTQHTKKIKTEVGVFYVHRIAPYFFDGFLWYKKEATFLIAEPEKALIDCLYLSAYKNKQFSYFPELYFPKSFSFKKAKGWIKKIHNPKISIYIYRRLEEIWNLYKNA